MHSHWYIGFDPATKTFGFIILKINIESLKHNIPKIIKDLHKTKNIKKCQEEVNSLFDIVDGDTIDLFPSKKNVDISLLERVESCAEFLKKRIIPQISQLNKENVTIVIESQMNHNDKSGIVPNVIISLFYDKANIIMVGASLKNTVHLYDRFHPKEYAKKLSWKTSIKNHTRFTLIELVKDLNIKTLLNKSNSEMGHIGDSFMQILGYIKNPDSNIKG